MARRNPGSRNRLDLRQAKVVFCAERFSLFFSKNGIYQSSAGLENGFYAFFFAKAQDCGILVKHKQAFPKRNNGFAATNLHLQIAGTLLRG